jgi:hypothetical protein
LAVQIVEDGIANIFFGHENALGQWLTDVIFEPPLMPVSLLRSRATWVIPEMAWKYVPPPGEFMPFTSRTYPNKCVYPPPYELFSGPAQ